MYLPRLLHEAFTSYIRSIKLMRDKEAQRRSVVLLRGAFEVRSL